MFVEIEYVGWLSDTITFANLFLLTLLIVLMTKLRALFYDQRKASQFDRNCGKVYGLDDIPGASPPVPIEFIGNVVRLLPLSKSIETGLKWARDYPGLYKVTGGNKTVVALTEASLVQQLLKSTDFGHHSKPPHVFDPMRSFLRNNLFLSTGKFWQRQRKVMMKTQNLQTLKASLGMVNKHSVNFVNEMRTLFQDGKPHEINKEINVFFLKVICDAFCPLEMITGKDIGNSKDFDQYHANFQIWKASATKRIIYPWFWFDKVWKLHPMSRVQDQAVDQLFNFSRKRVKEYKDISDSLRKSQNIPTCFLDELFQADMDEEQIVDEVNVTIFGGHETGASVIHNFCFRMALNQEIQEKCQEEVDQLFTYLNSFQGNHTIPYVDLQSRLMYVERCLLETLRLYPPAFILLRQLESPLSLEYEGKTFILPVGTVAAASPILTHRNPEYFPDPDIFDPDRFLPEQVAKRHAYSYFPFSSGFRNCMGQKFAMIQMKVVAAYLLRNFTMTTKDTVESVPLLPYVTLTPAKDYTFEFTKRFITET